MQKDIFEYVWCVTTHSSLHLFLRLFSIWLVEIFVLDILYTFCMPTSNKYWLLAIKEQTNNSLKD